MHKKGNGFSSSGDYTPPSHKSSTISSAKMDDADSAGVKSGVCCLDGFDSEHPLSPKVDNVTGRTSIGKKSVSSKGESMEFC